MKMRVTIIAEENRVNVEGKSETVDCLALYADDVHVIQWYGSFGEIEYFNAPGATTFKANEKITDFTPYQKFVDAWTIEAQKPIVIPVPNVLPVPNAA
jgi:hypothetical protein